MDLLPAALCLRLHHVRNDTVMLPDYSPGTAVLEPLLCGPIK